MALLNLMICIFLGLLMVAILAAMAVDLLGLREQAPAGELADWSAAEGPAPEPVTDLRSFFSGSLAPPVAEIRFFREGRQVHQRSLFATGDLALGAAEDPVMEDVAYRALTVRWEQGQPWFRAEDSSELPRYTVDGHERPITPREWTPWLSDARLELGGCSLECVPQPQGVPS